MIRRRISPPIADLLPCPEETGERLGIVGFEGNGFFKGAQCSRPVFLDDQKVAEPTLHLGGLGLEAHRGFVTGLGVVVPPQQLVDLTKVGISPGIGRSDPDRLLEAGCGPNRITP